MGDIDKVPQVHSTFASLEARRFQPVEQQKDRKRRQEHDDRDDSDTIELHSDEEEDVKEEPTLLVTEPDDDAGLDIAV